MNHRAVAVIVVSAILLWGCSSGGGDDGATAPVAPTNLAAAPLSGGAHLTWVDNSDNETEFMIMRMVGVDTTYQELTTVPFDTTQYHDAGVTPGTVYMYQIMAMNDAGAAESNEVTFTAP